MPSARFVVHPVVAVDLAGGELVVRAACEATVVDRGRPAPGARDDVIDLEAQGGAADPTGIDWPLALSVVARPHLPPHRGGDAIGPRGAGVLPGLLHRASPLGLVRKEQVQSGLEDLLRRGARLRVPLSRPGGLELVEELLRHGHVEAAEVGSEGLRLHRCRGPHCRGRRGRSLNQVGRRQFNRLNASRLRTGHQRKRRHHLLPRNDLGWPDLHRDRLRLLLRPMEEPRKDLGAVLRCDDPGQLEHDRDAQLAFPERRHHLGEPLDELGRHLPVVGGPPG